ncbi:hypothetical protein MD484_g6694, partial [Candolleomyces efflorescens]
MPAALHSRIAAFESLAGGTTSHTRLNAVPDDDGPSLLDAPLSAPNLQPVILTPSKPSPSPSPPNLGRKTSLIDLDDGRPANKLPPPLPPRKTPSYTSLKSVASTSSSHSASFLYPPRPRPDGPSTPLSVSIPIKGRHAQGSSVSSFHSVSLSSDTDPSTPGSIANFIATYPIDDPDPLTDSYEDVSTFSPASPGTERMISAEFDKARARAANRTSQQTILLPSATISSSQQQTPKLPQRPSPPTSIKSPPPLPSRNLNNPRSSGSSTPRSSPASPVSTPVLGPMIPTTYAVRRPPPAPPSRASHASASDRSSIQSTFSMSSSGHSHGSRIMTFNGNAAGSLNALAAAARTKRPTPVPLAARRRYEKVFRANVIQRRKAVEEQKKSKPKKENGLLSPNGGTSPTNGRGRGWRGLSVDLITGDPDSVAEQLNGAVAKKDKGKAKDTDSDSEDDEDLVKVKSKLFEKEKENEEVVGKDERLEGAIVKLVWKRCGLEKRRLAEIWNECDPTQTGSLDVDAFVKGMWRIDEELRRAQSQLLKSAKSSGLGINISSANSSRTSLVSSSKHSSIASNYSGRSTVPASLSRQSSVTSQMSSTGSRNAAYQKLTGAVNAPPPSAYNSYNGNRGLVTHGPNGYRGVGPGGGGLYNGNTSYGAGYSGSSNGGVGGLKNLASSGTAQFGNLTVTVPSVVRNILRGS